MRTGELDAVVLKVGQLQWKSRVVVVDVVVVCSIVMDIEPIGSIMLW